MDSGFASEWTTCSSSCFNRNNPADAFTKPLAAAPLQRHLSAVGIQTDVANEAGASASPTTTELTTGASITINQMQPGTAFVIKYKRYDNDDDVQMEYNS